MHPITFITLAYPGRCITEPLMLAESLREFGGTLADSPVMVLYPNTCGDFNNVERSKFKELDVETNVFDIDPSTQEFPFGTKVEAAAFAEKTLTGETELLAWLDSDTLVISELEEMLLQTKRVFGYRPVHHKFIGLDWNEPLDPFWKAVYHHCLVPVECDFPAMTTHTGEKIHPYINAGCFVIHPKRGILTEWRESFQSCYQSKEFLSFYHISNLYRIFLHQALFTATLLNMVEPGAMHELSHGINYPLHLHNEIPEPLRAKRITDLTTVRYEDIFSDPEWNINYPILEPLSGWIENVLQQG